MRLTLTQRLSLVFAVLLLVCSGTSAWMQVRSDRMHDMEVVQGLSRDLAASIARDAQLADGGIPTPASVREFFDELMVVNPSVEVYLLGLDGRIEGHAAPAGRLRRDRVDLAPVKRLLEGGALPIVGDDPRSDDGRKVFSAAPLQVAGRDIGFVYVVLLGEAHDTYAARGSANAVLRSALWSIGLVSLLCLVAGMAAFTLITRPLRRLTEAVRRFDLHAEPAPPSAPDARAGPSGPGPAGWRGVAATKPLPEPAVDAAASRDEIAVLEHAYQQLVARIGEQWRALARQDLERRELVANVSHDLRTPLASLHGCLETLLVKDEVLAPAERRRYLGIAIDQSRRVGALAQSLFELARLEYGFVEPVCEPFSLTDLVQDVFQKFELAAQAQDVALRADFTGSPPPVHADLGMIERVLSNLLDNALRHTPAGGHVVIALAPDDDAVEITVSDTGTGIAADRRDGLFERPFTIGGARPGGGLGLRIVHRILALHGSGIRLLDRPGPGASFAFSLPTRACPRAAGGEPARGPRPTP